MDSVSIMDLCSRRKRVLDSNPAHIHFNELCVCGGQESKVNFLCLRFFAPQRFQPDYWPRGSWNGGGSSGKLVKQSFRPPRLEHASKQSVSKLKLVQYAAAKLVRMI